MHTLTVCGAKGGTAKTTTAVTLAVELAALGRRVLLYDLDPQASATLALGMEPVAAPLEAEPVAIGEGGRLRLRPGGRALEDLTAAEARELLAREDAGVDVRVLDLPPRLGGLAVEALRVSALVLVPLRPSPLDLPAFRDVAALVASMEDPPRLRAVLTQVHSRRLLTRDVAEYLEAQGAGVLYGAQIPEDVRAAEAPGYGQAVTLYAPSSRAAEAYRELAREVAEDLTAAALRT
jgi:chromosome partitioning protein